MKKVYLFLTFIIFLGLKNLSGQPNLGFEDGDFGFYTLYYGQNKQQQKKFWFIKWCIDKGITNEVAGIRSPEQHKIMDNTIPSEEFDQNIGGTILPTVVEGRYSARIGSSILPLIAQRMVRSIAINSTNSDFKFNYAIVMKDPDHNKCQQPYFIFRVKKQNGSKVYEEKIIADNNDPYFKSRNGFLYKDWDCKKIDLSKYEGETLSFEFVTGTCSEGAADHCSYVYIDAIGGDILNPIFSTTKEVYCLNDNVIADGGASVGEIDHFWSIEESDEYGNRYPSTEVSKWFTASQAGEINLSDLYKELGGKFKCNTYYRIKLAVGNTCIPWKETTKIIKINCPKANAGRDVCCSDGTPKILGGSLPNPNYTYEWFPKYGLSNPFSSITNLDCTNQDIIEQGDCFEYTLRVTDQFGCQAEDKVRVFFEPPKFNILQEKSCCGIRLYIQDDGCYSSISWSNGEKNVSEIFIDQTGIYSVNLSNACGDALKSINITDFDIIEEFKEAYPKFIAGSAFTPNSDGVNDELEIFHFANDAPLKGDPVAYNSIEYELYVFDRGGIVHLVSSGTTCTGFYNGEIKWDGRINGQLVQDGVYTYYLKVKNCDYPLMEVGITNGLTFECIDCGFTLIGDEHCPGFFYGCREFGSEYFYSFRPSVRVIR